MIVKHMHKTHSNRIFEGEIFNVRVDHLNINETLKTRAVVEHAGGVVIACKPKPNEILLIRQYRYAIDQELIELPAGRLNKGEDRLVAAKRELIEETGYEAQNWEELPSMYSTPGFCDELLTCYIAQDVTWVGTKLDEDEEIDVIQVTLGRAWEMVLNGTIRDAKTIAVLAMVKDIK